MGGRGGRKGAGLNPCCVPEPQNKSSAGEGTVLAEWPAQCGLHTKQNSLGRGMVRFYKKLPEI